MLPNIPIHLNILAEMAGYSRSTFRKWKDKGKIKTKTIQNLVMVQPEEIKRLVDEGVIEIEI